MRSPRVAGLLVAAAVIAGCSTVATSIPPSGAASTVPTASTTAASPAPLQVSTSPEPSQGSAEASEAARRLLLADSAKVSMDVRRGKRETDPIETLLELDGRTEPSLGRGQILADFSGLFATSGASPAPNLETALELVWTPGELFARSPHEPDGAWTNHSRADARTGGGIVGRLPDEVEGLVKLLAESDRSALTPLEDAVIDGRVARRWTLRVPIEDAVAQGVPFEVPNAAVLRDTYGIREFEIEVSLVDGLLRRLRYAIAREHAAYGGPDRTTVTYDWTPAEHAEPIAVPSPTR